MLNLLGNHFFAIEQKSLASRGQSLIKLKFRVFSNSYRLSVYSSSLLFDFSLNYRNTIQLNSDMFKLH